MDKKDIPLMSSGVPSTLGNWYAMTSATMGENSSPAKFLKEKMDEQGADEPVVADEGQLLHVLGRMLVQDLEGEEWE